MYKNKVISDAFTGRVLLFIFVFYTRLITGLLTHCIDKSTGDVRKLEILIQCVLAWDQRFCISNKLSGDPYNGWFTEYTLSSKNVTYYLASIFLLWP